MKRISFIVVMFVVFCIIANADEWINFNDSEASVPSYDVTNSTSSIVTFELEIPGMNSTDVDAYNRVYIPEHSRMDSVGYPEVPFVSYLVAIPECDNVILNITVSDSVVIDNMNIYPAPEWIEHSNGDNSYMEEQFTINNAFYNSDEYFPGYTGELVEKGAVRDQNCIRLKIYPVQFNPVQQQVTAYSRINVEMTFNNAIGSVNNDVGIFNEVCGNAMINYTSNGLSASISSGTSRDGSWAWLEPVDLSGEYVNPACDYLIITHENFYSNENTRAAIDSLAKKRADYNGFDVRIVKYVDIVTNVTGDNNSEKMRNLIRNTYNHENANNTWDSKLGYVLLFGDAFFGDDPTADCVPTYPYRNLPADTLGYDVYFSRLTEINGLPDIYPDVLIGRIPADEEAHIINSSTKIVDFEPIQIDGNYNGWKDRLLFINSAFESQANQAYGMILPFTNSYENILLSYRYPNQNPPAGMFQQFGYSYNPTSPHDATLESYYTAGNLIVTYMGHGGSWRLHPDAQYWWGFGQIENDPNHNGILPFIVSSSCGTGSFQAMQKPDYVQEYESFAENFLSYSDNKGTIAIIAASTASDAGAFYEFVPFFYEGLSSSLFLTGELNLFAKLKTPTKMYADHYNLIGDPATNIYLDTEIIAECDLVCSPLEITINEDNLHNVNVISGIKNLSSVNAQNVNVECILTDVFSNQSIIENCTIDLIEGMSTESANFNFNDGLDYPTTISVEIIVDPDNLIPERNENNNNANKEFKFYREINNFPSVVDNDNFIQSNTPLYWDKSIISAGTKIDYNGNVLWSNDINSKSLFMPTYNINDDHYNYVAIIKVSDLTDGIVVIDGQNGSIQSSYTLPDNQRSLNYCIGDINNDGSFEIIVSYVNLPSYSGTLILDDNLNIIETIMSSSLLVTDISIGDSDNNGINELFILEGIAPSCLRKFEYDGSNYNLIDNIVLDTPSYRINLADHNDDGELDCIVYSTSQIKILNASDFDETLFDISLDSTLNMIAIGDINNDGNHEVVVLENSGALNVIDSGSYYNLFSIPTSQIRVEGWYNGLLLYDLNGNNQLDIVINNGESISGYSQNGTPIFEFPHEYDQSNSVIVDIDKNNNYELISIIHHKIDAWHSESILHVSDLTNTISNHGNIYPCMNECNNNLYSQSVSGILLENTDYIWDGSITLHGEVSLPVSSTLTILPGTIIKTKENSKLTCYGDIFVNGTENYPVKFIPAIVGASEDYWQGLEFPEGNTYAELNYMNIENGSITAERNLTIDCGSFINTPLTLNGASLNANNVEFNNSPILAELYGIQAQSEMISLSDCNIANLTNDAGIEITGYPSVYLANNTINNCTSGIKIWESGSGVTHSLNDNYITNNAEYGLLIYHSNIDIEGSNLLANNNEGLFVMHDSNFSMIGSEDYPLQNVHDNLRHEVRFTYDSRPSEFYHNKIYDNAHDYSYIKCDDVPLINEPIIISNNNWGTTFNTETDLSPMELFTYLPIWYPGVPDEKESGTDEELFLTALTAEENSEYEVAEQTYEQVISFYPSSEYSVISAKKLFDLKVKYDQDFYDLKLYYETEPNMQYNDELSSLAEFLITCCNVKLEEFEPAINWFEEIIQNPPTIVDSVFAVIDAGYTYLVMGNSRSSFSGKISELKPKSKKQYAVKRDELIDLLFGDSEPENEIPQIFELKLYPNYPNPFNPETTRSFSITEECKVGLSIYNIKGQRVRTLVNSVLEKGLHDVIWNSIDDAGK